MEKISEVQVPCGNVLFVVAETVPASGAVILTVGFVFFEEVSPAVTIVATITVDLLVNDVFIGLAEIIVPVVGGETDMLGVEKAEEI